MADRRQGQTVSTRQSKQERERRESYTHFQDGLREAGPVPA